jgi:paraquat-inducible protein A
MNLKPLTEGQQARCPRCGHHVMEARADRFVRALAFASAALVLLPIAMSYPFLAFSASGLENEFRLPESVVILFENHGQALGLLVLGFIVVLPAFVLLNVIVVVIPLLRQRGTPWLVGAGRTLFGVSPWTMVEVFMIGVIVSLVKIAHMATIALGISFWAYVAFAVCFIGAMAQMDRLAVWRAIERVAPP